jgi:hypothetical protein
VLHQVARFQPLGLALDDLADRSAIHRLAYLKRRNVAFHIVHPAAHVRVDGEPQVAHPHGPVFERREIELLELEILGFGHSLWAAFQMPCARHDLLLWPGA